MKDGEEKTITVPPEKAYGFFVQKKIVTVKRVISLPRFVTVSVEQYKRETGRTPVEGEFFNISGLFWEVRIASIIGDTILADLSLDTDIIPDPVVGERIVSMPQNEIILELNLDSEPSGEYMTTKLGNGRILSINETTIILDFIFPVVYVSAWMFQNRKPLLPFIKK